jgi:HAD superfamily hydrolase (TIGR01509 family)
MAYMRSSMHFADLFDATFCSAEVGVLKSDPGFFRAVERDPALSGGEILFWDDSAANVACARDCGWHAELYTDFGAFQRVMAAYAPKMSEPVVRQEASG